MEFLIKTSAGQQLSSKSLDTALRDAGLHKAGGRLTKSQALARIKKAGAELYIRKNHYEGWTLVEDVKQFTSGESTSQGGSPDDGLSDSQPIQSTNPDMTTTTIQEEVQRKSNADRIAELEQELKEKQERKESLEQEKQEHQKDLAEACERQQKLEDIGLWDDDSMTTARESIEQTQADALSQADDAQDLIEQTEQRIEEIEKELEELKAAPEESTDVPVGKSKVKHPMQDVLIRRCKAVQTAHNMSQDALYPMLVGPAGSGKTTAARNVALEIFGETAIEDGKFGMMSLNEESERSEGFGFISPIDKMYKSTDFRRIYENGGVFLLDEVDAANANTLTALNAAISAPFASFPDKIVKRSPDFILIAAANTFGNGADGLYVGRNELDAATRDRFLTMVWNYDWDGIRAARPGHKALVTLIERLSNAAISLEMQHIISPRAALFAPFMIAQGDSLKEALDACVFKGLPKDDVDTLLSKVGMSVSELETI